MYFLAECFWQNLTWKTSQCVMTFLGLRYDLSSHIIINFNHLNYQIGCYPTFSLQIKRITEKRDNVQNVMNNQQILNAKLLSPFGVSIEFIPFAQL